MHKKKGKSKLKILLMMQSLSPLALLTIVNNFNFCIPNEKECTWAIFIQNNQILLIVFIVCFIWLCTSVHSYIVFKAFKWGDKKSGYQIKDVEQEENAGLNFFLSMIIPLLIDNVSKPSGAITLLLIVMMMFGLLGKTNLFYANPVLAVMGYRIYKFQFVANSEEKGECIGLCRGKMEDPNNNTFEYKKIADSVFYIKEAKDEGK